MLAFLNVPEKAVYISKSKCAPFGDGSEKVRTIQKKQITLEFKSAFSARFSNSVEMCSLSESRGGTLCRRAATGGLGMLAFLNLAEKALSNSKNVLLFLLRSYLF